MLKSVRGRFGQCHLPVNVAGGFGDDLRVAVLPALMRPIVSERIGRLCESPELQKLVSNPRVELVRHTRSKARALDELLNIHEVPASMRSDDA